MSTPREGAPVQDERLPELPELPEARIAEIEDSLFAAIADDRRARRARRGRWWIGGSAAAAIVVVAAFISPMVVPLVSGSGADSSTVEGAGSAPVAPDSAGGSDGAESSGEADSGAAVDEAGGGKTAEDSSVSDAGRDIITTASATVVVDDVPAAAREVADAADAAGGYVESMSIGQSGQVYPVDPGISYDTYPYPYPSPDGAWVTVRVPADQLTSVIDDLSGLGEVTASSINRQDVTDQTIDLQARVDAAQASVDRLTELMAQAGDLSDLIAAEAALSERQATLESYQQQLEMLDDQVAMSTLTVTLTPVAEPVEADPAGFTDGLAAGWNGLVATLNGIVVAIGFLIPWILVIAVIALIVWGIVRLVRRRRADRAARSRAAAAAARASEADQSGPERDGSDQAPSI